MPTRKASELEPGLVLIDPKGHLYEIVAVHVEVGDQRIHVWLWPDTSKVPDAFQSFDHDEEINFVHQHVNGDVATQLIPAVTDEPVEDGAAE